MSQGFSLVLLHHRERDCLVAFGGSKKELSNQVKIKNSTANMHGSIPDLLFY